MPTLKTPKKTLVGQGANLCSKTVTVVWMGLCTQSMTSGGVSAEETQAKTDRPTARAGRTSSQMGVSVTVMPTCAIRMPDGSAVGIDGQPLNIQCSQDSAYSLNVSEGSGKLSNRGLGGRQTQVYSLEKADVDDREVTILSINF